MRTEIEFGLRISSEEFFGFGILSPELFEKLSPEYREMSSRAIKYFDLALDFKKGYWAFYFPVEKIEFLKVSTDLETIEEYKFRSIENVIRLESSMSLYISNNKQYFEIIQSFSKGLVKSEFFIKETNFKEDDQIRDEIAFELPSSVLKLASELNCDFYFSSRSEAIS